MAIFGEYGFRLLYIDVFDTSSVMGYGFYLVPVIVFVILLPSIYKANSGKGDTKKRCTEVVTVAAQRSQELEQHVQTVSSQRVSLKPQAAQQKNIALQQARLIWADDMVVKGEEIKNCASRCDALYNRLTTLRTIPSERDWPCVDDVIGKISSGRADSLKEALQLIDTDTRHRELMSMQAAQLGEHVKLRKQIREDVRDLGHKVELTRDEIRRQHTADRDQRDLHHAQQMAAEAAQIALQAATYYEQNKFHNEVRRQGQQTQPPTP